MSENDTCVKCRGCCPGQLLCGCVSVLGLETLISMAELRRLPARRVTTQEVSAFSH